MAGISEKVRFEIEKIDSEIKFGITLLRQSQFIAEREGFEPSVRLPAHTLSRRAS